MKCGIKAQLLISKVYGPVEKTQVRIQYVNKIRALDIV